MKKVLKRLEISIFSKKICPLGKRVRFYYGLYTIVRFLLYGLKNPRKFRQNEPNLDELVNGVVEFFEEDNNLSLVVENERCTGRAYIPIDYSNFDESIFDENGYYYDSNGRKAMRLLGKKQLSRKRCDE